MAKRLGVSAAMYGRYERGYIDPPPETVEAMATAFGADPAEWLRAAGYEPVGPVEVSVESPPADLQSAELPIVGILRGAVVYAPRAGMQHISITMQGGYVRGIEGVIRVEGAASIPFLLPGDILLVRSAAGDESEGTLVVARKGKRRLLGYLARTGKGMELEGIGSLAASDATGIDRLEYVVCGLWRAEEVIGKVRP